MSKQPHRSKEKPPLKAIAAQKAGALSASDSVETAGHRLRDHQADLWPVTEDRKLIGVVESANPDWKISGAGHDPKAWKVGEIMSRELVFCYEDEDCAAARKLMQERGLRYLPVVDRQMRIVGIFSREEIEEKADR
jgi:CBS domain-containing protein